jgi:hypothetical protein
MHIQTWEFKFRESSSQYQKAKDMIVYMTHTDERNDMEITIFEKGAHTLFDATILWDLTPVDDSIASPTGKITLSNSENTWGRVYSRDLYVETCPTLQQLNIAVDLSKQQPRDRHLLPPQLMETVADILKQALLKQGIAAVKQVVKHIPTKLYSNREDYNTKQAAVALEPAMRKYYAAVHECPVKKIQFIFRKCNPVDQATLKELGHHAIELSGPLAYGFSMQKLRLDAIKHGDIVKPGNKPGLNAANMYFIALRAVIPEKYKDMKLRFVETVATGECLIDHGKSVVIYVSSDLADGDKCVTAAIHIHARVMALVGNRATVRAEVVEKLRRFMLDPYNFGKKSKAEIQAEAAKKRKRNPNSPNYEGDSDADEINNIDDSDSDDNFNDQYGLMEVVKPKIKPSPPKKKKKRTTEVDISDAILHTIPKQLLRHRPNTTALQKCAHTAVPTVLTSDSSSVATKANFSRVHVQYTPTKLVHVQVSEPGSTKKHDVYISKILHGAKMKACFARPVTPFAITNISNALHDIRQCVAKTLGIEKAKLPIIMVVCEHVHAFTHDDAVFINIGALLHINEHTDDVTDDDVTIGYEEKQSFLLTILHQLAHRAHADDHSNDDNYTKEFGRLVYACRKCLDADDTCLNCGYTTD